MKKIKLEWQGETYVIPENRAFEAVDEMEQHVTLGTITQYAQEMRIGKLARAYSALLTCAGAPDCSPQEVAGWMRSSLRAMFEKASQPGANVTQEEMQDVFFGAVVKELSEILMDGAPTEDNPEPPKKKGASSKKLSK